MTAYTLRCSKCKKSQEYTESKGAELYSSADLDGWQFQIGVGNTCPACAFKTVGQRITKPIVSQAALI